MIDLAIIGGGPAGLTAGLYATRGGLKNVIMYEKGMPGGQITSSSEIENYPGISVVTDGISFMAPWSEQCTRFGLKIEMKSVERVEKISNGFCLHFEDGSKQEAKCVIVCTGSKPRRAGIKAKMSFLAEALALVLLVMDFFIKVKK